MPTTEEPVHHELQCLYREHREWLVGWLRTRLRCHHQAADIAQDTFLRLLGRGQPMAIERPRAYLSTIANGLVVGLWRREQIERAYLEALAARADACTPSEEERALVFEALERVARLLDGLPLRVREAFLLSRLDGLGYAQIAERQGVSVNAVQKSMLRAYRHCYQLLYG
ncbi:sigma-70 family RNA polymerase sigma factor [Halotalea alkalilenta]|uniref:RNA polymerase subunit sigma n=1 Tax=Halotalea alkalilenta TaxID=376489 RepID=A0A172YBF7_9GAMM|nr:sigma-70 family RNA polymerase sigma factor [Halotalea alkalilenta]ANF56579.1 RNA polymerase subunit sigma [Halotalea alkalilenta]